MHRSDSHDPQAAVPDGAPHSFSHRELNILGDIFRLLPTGITVQDEHGRFLLMNDAAAQQLGASAPSQTSSQSAEFNRRCKSAIELLRSGRSFTEETITAGPSRQVFLTTHQPVRIAGCDLLLSSTADITEQKNFEDQLFRSAYYDELTDLPARRVIEYRVNSLLKQGEDQGQFALAFLDIDNFKHINDYYGHSTGDALLVQLTKRLGLDLRQSEYAVTNQRRRIPAATASDLQPAGGRRLSRSAIATDARAVLHRSVRNLRLHFGRRQPLSRSRPKLRRAAAECRYRDVPGQERRQGRRDVLRRQHGA